MQLKTYMRKAWGAFVRDPHRGPGWPAVGRAKDDQEVELLGNVGSVQTGSGKLVTASSLDEKCKLYRPIYESLIEEGRTT